MGIIDAFGAEDRVNLKVSDLVNYFRSEAQTYARNEVMLNGIKSNMPYAHILAMIGELNTEE